MIGFLAAASLAALLPGTYTNEEQVYFAGGKGGAVPPWVGLKIETAGAGLRLRTVDALGKPGPEDEAVTVSGDSTTVGGCTRSYRADGDGFTAVAATGSCKSPAYIAAAGPAGLTLKLADGSDLDLRRAHPFTCWAAIRKAAPKPDGSEDWQGKFKLPLHDAGGRVLVSSDEPTPQSLVLRMRNVVWSEGPNRPSLVLYVHKPEDPKHAVSYAWADPEASRVGINLRWMQASCTRDAAPR